MTDDEYALRYIGWRYVDRGRRTMRAGGCGWVSPNAFMAPVPLESAVRLQAIIERWQEEHVKVHGPE